MNTALKVRHNITLSQDIWKVLLLLKNVNGKSVSETIELCVKKFLANQGYQSTYLKIMSSVSACDDDENEELTKILDTLTEDDLEVSDEYRLDSSNPKTRSKKPKQLIRH
jgi:hypothetical protein